MQVLHFYKTYITESYGGVGEFIFQLINGVYPLGIKSEVLSLTLERAPKTIHLENHKVHRVYQNFEWASTGISLSALGRFKELACASDIIHYHYPWPFMDLVHFLSQIKKPTILTYHSDIIKQKHLYKLYQPLMHAFLSQMDHIIATSPNYLKTSAVLKEYSNKISVIPIGLDKNAYPDATSDQLNHWRSELGAKFFLFVGRLAYYKGLHTLLKAMEGLNFPLVIVGAGTEEMALKKQAQAGGLKNIYFLGELSKTDKIAVLTLCYALVFPSHLRSEAFGISLLEAAMFSKALISCEIGTGTSYINQHEKTGLVIEPENVLELRQALIRLWDNPEEVAKMGETAAKRYKKLFTSENMSLEYSKIYQLIKRW